MSLWNNFGWRAYVLAIACFTMQIINTVILTLHIGNHL